MASILTVIGWGVVIVAAVAFLGLIAAIALFALLASLGRDGP